MVKGMMKLEDWKKKKKNEDAKKKNVDYEEMMHILMKMDVKKGSKIEDGGGKKYKKKC